jgi:hypothetical protein
MLELLNMEKYPKWAKNAISKDTKLGPYEVANI